jgi:hypothetical protein
MLSVINLPFKLIFVILNVVILNVVMLNAVMPSVIMLNVVMLSIVVPCKVAFAPKLLLKFQVLHSRVGPWPYPQTLD